MVVVCGVASAVDLGCWLSGLVGWLKIQSYILGKHLQNCPSLRLRLQPRGKYLCSTAVFDVAATVVGSGRVAGVEDAELHTLSSKIETNHHPRLGFASGPLGLRRHRLSSSILREQPCLPLRTAPTLLQPLQKLQLEESENATLPSTFLPTAQMLNHRKRSMLHNYTNYSKTLLKF